MEWLNYHHLLYFWTAAREGGVRRAAEVLHLSQPTVSVQIRDLERSLGVKLFTKAGRGLALTEEGRQVYAYAEEIFALGRELLDVVRGRPVGRLVRFRVGLVDALPKPVVARLLEPALALPERVALECREGRLDRLVAELSIHNLDVVLSDAPVDPALKARVYSHPLGESGVSVMGVARLARRYRRGFPGSLGRAPLLLPADATVLRRSLNSWLAAQGLRPDLRGEFEDTAMLLEMGRRGEGLVVVPTAVEGEVQRMYGVAPVGRLPDVRERYYAVSVERRVRHPAVAAISREGPRFLAGEPNS